MTNCLEEKSIFFSTGLFNASRFSLIPEEEAGLNNEADWRMLPCMMWQKNFQLENAIRYTLCVCVCVPFDVKNWLGGEFVDRAICQGFVSF